MVTTVLNGPELLLRLVIASIDGITGFLSGEEESAVFFLQDK
jgi:hypothetical protein